MKVFSYKRTVTTTGKACSRRGVSRCGSVGTSTAAQAESSLRRVAEHYLTLCFTHPEYTNDVETRNALMTEMEAAGVPENCGWEQGGEIAAVSSITFNGQVESREEYTKEDGSRVAYLGFFVTLDNGKFYTATGMDGMVTNPSRNTIVIYPSRKPGTTTSTHQSDDTGTLGGGFGTTTQDEAKQTQNQ